MEPPTLFDTAIYYRVDNDVSEAGDFIAEYPTVSPNCQCDRGGAWHGAVVEKSVYCFQIYQQDSLCKMLRPLWTFRTSRICCLIDFSPSRDQDVVAACAAR